MDLTPNPVLVQIRLFILSDTRSIELEREDGFSHAFDIAIHCANLTEESKSEEYQTSLRLPIDIPAPLKLVIAGNHDFTMNIPIY